MLALRLRLPSAASRLARPSAPSTLLRPCPNAATWPACPRRAFSSRFSNTRKKRVELKEAEAERPSSYAPYSEQAQYGGQSQQGQTPYGAPGTAFPSYVDQQDERRRQSASSTYESLSEGAVAHMRKVYGTLAAGVGIAAGASLFAMGTPLVGMHPLIPSLAAMVPLMGIMYTSNHTMGSTARAGLFAAFTGLSGVAMAPLLGFALKVSPVLVPQALMITTGIFGAMTALSLMAKPGATLRWGVPLGGGMLVLMALGLGSMFVPVTSAWYPLLHSIQLYGGLAIFTAYVAYDTQKMIDEYMMGEDDHIKHATDLFIDFKVIFTRILSILMLSRDD